MLSSGFQALTVPMMIWLLRHRFLYQVHSFVTLLPPADAAASDTATTESRTTRSDLSDSSTDASSLGTCVFAPASGNDVTAMQSLSVGDADSSGNSTVGVRRSNVVVKDHAVSSELTFKPKVAEGWQGRAGT